MQPDRPVQQCPHCKLPLTRQESREQNCPVCRELLYDVAPNPDELLDVHNIADDVEDVSLDVDLPPDEQQEPIESKKRVGLAITIAAVLLLLIAGIALTGIFLPRRDDRDRRSDRTNRLAAVTPEPSLATRSAADDVKPPVKPAVLAAAREALRARDRQDIPDMRADIPPDQDLPDRGMDVEINAPRGRHTIEPVAGNDSFKLSGTVKKLTIAGVHDQGVLITEKLAAEEVVVAGSVNGSGTLKLDVPGGAVTFLGSLDGAAKVRVNAPGGKVTCGPVDQSPRGGGIIVGSANVTIIARDVDLRGVVDGGARVTVTLTEGGSLRFSRIAGGAHVHYRKAKPGDGDPKIERGNITAGGKFARIEPPKPPASSPKIELDLTKLDANGLRGPVDGKVSVAYEFCIPNTAKYKAQVKAIDPGVRLMPGSRGRIGAGKDQCLCVGETGANYRTVLNRLAALSYVKRIVECHFE